MLLLLQYNFYSIAFAFIYLLVCSLIFYLEYFSLVMNQTPCLSYKLELVAFKVKNIC